MNSYSESEYMDVKFKIKPKPEDTYNIDVEVKRQYFKIIFLLAIAFIIIILLVKEYIAYLRVIKTMSITEFLQNN